MQEGALSRRELKQLMQRSNTPGLLRLLLWFVMLLASGSLIWLAGHTLWLWPAMLLHGIVLVHHFSLQHECIHYTAFKTRWLNDWIGNYCGFVIMLPNRFFRYEHCDHHTYTQLSGQDPEMIPLPRNFAEYFLYLSSWPYWRAKFSELWRHIMGRLSPEEKRFFPREEYPKIFLEARIMAAAYAAIVVFCAISGWWAPVWYWWLPVLLGEPVMRAIRMTEHVGRPDTHDMKINTRSNLVAWPWRFLCWNMNYHAEHHYASSVPFYALPALHQKLSGFVHVERGGYLGAHRDIWAQLRGRTPRSDHPPGLS